MDVTATSDDPYCSAHILVGPAPAADTANATDRALSRPEMAGKTLLLDGEYQAPGSDTWQAFHLDSALTDGVIVPLCRQGGDCASPELPLLPVGSPLEVRVSRSPGGLFQGLAWDRATDDVERGRAVLRNLMDGASALVAERSG
jgi:hypothetical protein